MILHICIGGQFLKGADETVDCGQKDLLARAKKSPPHTLTVDLTFLDSWFQSSLEIANIICNVQPPTLYSAHQQHVSLAILVVHGIHSNYKWLRSNYKWLRSMLEMIELPGGEGYWSITYVVATRMMLVFTGLLLLQLYAGMKGGLQLSDAAMNCSIMGLFLMECVPCISVLSCFWLSLFENKDFPECVAVSIAVSGISVVLSYLFRTVLAYAISMQKATPHDTFVVRQTHQNVSF